MTLTSAARKGMISRRGGGWLRCRRRKIKRSLAIFLAAINDARKFLTET